MIVPWTARRSNQSILKEINPEYSLEGLIMEKPKLTLRSDIIWGNHTWKTTGLNWMYKILELQ